MADPMQVRLDAKLLRALASKSGDADLQAAAKRGDVLETDFQQAIAAGNVANAATAAQDLATLKQTAQALTETRTSSPGQSIRMSVSVLGLFAVMAGFGWFLIAYGQTVGLAKLGTIEGTRPLLVIGAILSTVIFGGSLLIGSLFSSEGTFEDRFRHAREVFLVFSGIFGTVIGFYFGAGDSKGESPAVSAQLADAVLVAHASGGIPPYKVTLTYGNKPCMVTLDSKDGWARFALNKSTENVEGSRLSVVDSRGAQSSNITLPDSRADLTSSGWALPAQSSCDAKADVVAPRPVAKPASGAGAAASGGASGGRAGAVPASSASAVR